MRIAARIRDVTPVVLALVAVKGLGIITGLHAIAERRAIREVARQQRYADIAVLDEHPVRDVLPREKPPLLRQPVTATHPLRDRAQRRFPRHTGATTPNRPAQPDQEHRSYPVIRTHRVEREAAAQVRLSGVRESGGWMYPNCGEMC
ncbi:hypothetical protein ACFXGA_15320 [Actinosynnema sp. NPDC059335]|uniref:hypothetical protein n=1 Tax=Actinosynnema sp. NPDC059335 TaxID=3346804 RepID=UPI00366CD270